MVGIVCVTPRLWKPVGGFLVVVWRTFFWPQYRLRMRRWFGRPDGARFVDGPLDDAIPFRAGEYPRYLSFVDVWVGMLADVRAAAGPKSMAMWLAFLRELERLYLDAGAISRELPTTTRRPRGFRTPRLVFVKFFDPHYHCLPSLHILIVFHALSKAREWMPALEAAGAPDTAGFARRIRDDAVAVAESVLDVKQHSISCIAASLFFLTARDAAIDEDFAEEMIAAMFAGRDDVPVERIRTRMRDLYAEFLRRHREEKLPWRQVLEDYIRSRPEASAASGDSPA